MIVSVFLYESFLLYNISKVDLQVSEEFGYYGAFLEKAEVRNKIHVGNLTFSDGFTAEKILIGVRNEHYSQ